MELNEMFKNIKELGQAPSKRIELREYCNLKIDEILKGLPRRILSNDGAQLIDCMLKGLSDHAQNKSKLIQVVLELIRKESMPLTYCGDIISRLSLELSKLPIENLLKWSSDSVQSIVEDNDVNRIWRDILPECLNIICTHAIIKQLGTEMSGVEYKIQCIHTLCQCSWKETQLIQLTAMFTDIQLTKEHHKQVVNKICSYVINLPPDTLPPLVHQLLKLCKQHNLEIVLSHLSHYFSLRLYSKLDPPPQDSESTTLDIDDIVQHSPEELSRCLSTCLYHLSQGLADPEVIRKHIKQWPKTQVLRSPFLIDVALAVSDKGADFRTVCLDVIKSAIELRIQDELKCKESAWVSSVMAPDVDVASVLKALTTESANHRQLTVVGLINLAFSLLSVSRPKPTAPHCWALGQMVLVRLCKAQPETTSHILSQLADKLFGDSTQSQYSECLYILCKQAPVSVERCSQVMLIVEGCQGSDAVKTYEALRPLLSFSEKTRDTLVKVCRKHLYSRDSQHRRLALAGFLCVLRHTRLSAAWSECSQPGGSHSYLSQLTVDLHATHHGGTVTSRARNEIVCLEIVSILRRCLVQDAAVKQYLYSEIYSCAKEKKALHESILEMLYEHLSKYVPEDSQGPVLLDECVNKNAVLTEPIGHLLYTIAQFLQVEEDDSEDVLDSQGENPVGYLKNKLTTIMQNLCLADWLAVFNLEEPLSDLTPESKVRGVKVQQALQCYEALIAYQIMQWTPLNANATSVHRLHGAYVKLLESTKGSPKVTKKTKANESKETTKSQKSQKSQKSKNGTETTKSKRKGKAPVTFASAAKDKAGPFKPLPCVWDLKLGLRVLELLYSEEVPWSSPEQRNQLRSKREFNLQALRALQSALHEGLPRHVVATHVLRLAALLHARCVCKFQDMYSFDEHVMFACLELYKACLNLLLSSTYTFKAEDVLLGLTGVKDTTESECLADVLIALYNSLKHLEKEREDDCLDAVGKKTYSILVQICTMFMEMPVKACFVLSEVLSKLESLSRCSPQADSVSLATSALAAGARDDRDALLLDAMLAKITLALEYIYEEDRSSSSQETDDFPSIDEKTGHAALGSLCAHLTERLKCTEHLLCKARDLSSAINYTPHSHHTRIKRELKELYESILIQLCQLTTWTSSIAMLRCSIGKGSDRVLNLCLRLYTLLAAYVKQLDLNMAQALHLEKLLILSGRALSKVLDGLVEYVEASQRERSVLRDTRLVPRLVRHAELFNRNVMMLGKGTYQQYLTLGNARDFKISRKNLQDKLNTTNTQTTADDIDDASTVHIENRSDESDVEGGSRKRTTDTQETADVEIDNEDATTNYSRDGSDESDVQESPMKRRRS